MAPKRGLQHMFFCEYWEISKNTYFEEHLRIAASVQRLPALQLSFLITLFFIWEPVNFAWGWLFLIFFIFEAEIFLICSYFLGWTLQYHKECQTEYNKNTISFLSFFFFQAAHIGIHWLAGFKSATLLKLNPFTGIFHRSWTQMQLYTL